MKLIHTLLVVLASTLLLVTIADAAPDPCAKLKSQTDAFGATTRGTLVHLDVGGYTAVAITELDGKATLTVMTVLHGVSDLKLPAGHLVRLALDGQALELRTREPSLPVANATSETAYTQWVLAIDLDAAALKKLAATPIAAVALKVGNQGVQMAVKKRPAKKLLGAAQCLAGGEE